MLRFIHLFSMIVKVFLFIIGIKLVSGSPCTQPLQIGICKENVERYYYNTSDNLCHYFIYSGCYGNLNNFLTEEECEKTCKIGINSDELPRVLNSKVNRIFGSYSVSIQSGPPTSNTKVLLPIDRFDGRPVCNLRPLDPKNVPFRFGREDNELEYSNGNKIWINVARDLSCTTSSYNFVAEPVFCDSKPPNGLIEIFIDVQELNKYSPYFTDSDYIGRIPEGSEAGYIVLTFNAADDDCSSYYSSICRFTILTPDMPFAISNGGVLTSTESLNYSDASNYIFHVEAVDCGGLSSDPMIVTVIVESKLCRVELSNVPDSLDYTAEMSSSFIHLYSGSDISECSDCFNPQISISVSLYNEMAICRPNIYVLGYRLIECATQFKKFDLLPVTNAENFNDIKIYDFEGLRTMFSVPKQNAPAILPEKFSLRFWYKLADPDSTKKQIIVAQNGFAGIDNCVHFKMFIKHCTFGIRLIRPTFEVHSHWKLPLGHCDTSWHSVAMNYEYKNESEKDMIELYFDGILLQHNDTGKIPLKATNSDSSWSIGALWREQKKVFQQYFNGSLAAISIVIDGHTTPKDIACMLDCYGTGLVENIDGEVQLIRGHIDIVGHRSEVLERLRKVCYVSGESNKPQTVVTTMTVECSKDVISFESRREMMIMANPSLLSPVFISPRDTRIVLASASAANGIEPFQEFLLDGSVGIGKCIFKISPIFNQDEGIIMGWNSDEALSLGNEDELVVLKGDSELKSYEQTIQSLIYYSDVKRPVRNITIRCDSKGGIQGIEAQVHIYEKDEYEHEFLEEPSHSNEQDLHLQQEPPVVSYEEVSRDHFDFYKYGAIVLTIVFVVCILFGISTVLIRRYSLRRYDNQDDSGETEELDEVEVINIMENPIDYLTGEMALESTDDEEDNYDDDYDVEDGGSLADSDNNYSEDDDVIYYPDDKQWQNSQC